MPIKPEVPHEAPTAPSPDSAADHISLITLEYLEQYIQDPDRNSEAFDNAQEGIIDAIAHDAGYIIALVFSKDHQTVRAVPLPELFDTTDHRKVIENKSSKVDWNLSTVRSEVFRLLDWQKTHPVHGEQDDVIIFEKNLGKDRHKPIIVATLDAIKLHWIDPVHMDRIQQTQAKLNSPPSSSK